MKTLKDYKNEFGAPLWKIAEISGIPSKDTVFRCVNEPSRVTQENMLRVAAVVGMPFDDAINEWFLAKFEKLENAFREKEGSASRIKELKGVYDSISKKLMTAYNEQ